MRRVVIVVCSLAVFGSVALFVYDITERTARPTHVMGPNGGAWREAPPLARRPDGRFEGSFGADRTEDADVAVLRCAWDGTPRAGVIRATRVDEAAGEPNPWSAPGPSVASGDDLTLRLDPGTYWFTLETPGHEAEDLGVATLDAGDVRSCTLGEGRAPVAGAVRDTKGAPVEGAMVYGCGPVTRSDTNGAFWFPDAPTACVVSAVWRDGLLSRRGEPAYASAFQRELVVVVDTTPIAGLGIRFSSGPDGVTVTGVHAGTPADAAGLVEGDLIVEVDGRSVEGVATADFIAIGTGRERSVADLVVLRNGTRARIRVTRERIAEPTPTTEDSG